MEAELGSFYAASRVIAVDLAPNQHDALVIQHVIIPSEAEQLLSNWEETTESIGGKEYPAIVRTVIMLASDYSSSSPAANSAMPIGSDNRFNGLGYVLWDRDCVKTGLPLEPVFRVDRRIYIKASAQTDYGLGDGNLRTTTTQELALSSGFTLPGNTATAKYTADEIGNGFHVKRGETQTLFPKQANSHEQAVAIPSRFVTSSSSEAITIAGTSTTPDTLGTGGSGVVSASAEQVDAYRIRKTKEERQISDSLNGSQLFTNYGGGVADVVETITADDANVESGFSVLSSTITPIGGGKAVKEVVTANDDFAELLGQTYDPDLGFDIPFTEKVVAAGATHVNADIQPLDKWRSKVKSVDYDAFREQLDAVHIILPGEENVNVPDTLTSVTVLVTRSQAIGNAYGQGNGYNISMDGNVSLSADLSYEIAEGYVGPVAAETHVFFMPQDQIDPMDFIKTKCTAVEWPRYRPTTKRVVMAGSGMQQSVRIASSDNGSQGSESSTVQAFSNVATIPRTIHAEITPTIEYHDFVAPTGVFDDIRDTAIAQWEARIAALQDLVDAAPSGTDPFVLEYLRSYVEGMEGTIDLASNQDITDFEVAVSPAVLAPTVPTAVQEGRFIMRSNATIYGFGMVKVTVVVAIV